MLKSNNEAINYVPLQDENDGTETKHRRYSNKSKTNDSGLFDLNKPHSLNFANVKSKHFNNKNNIKQSSIKRNINTYATHKTIDERSAYNQTLSDKFNKKRFERLNFEFTTTEVKHREIWNRRKNWIGRAIQTRGLWKWCMCLAIGIFTGTCMFLISIAIEALVGLNLNWANDALKSSFAVGFLRFLGVNCLFALISGSLVSFIAPPAAGSGIPDVKGWLNGSSIPGLFQKK
eukprot:67352_1